MFSLASLLETPRSAAATSTSCNGTAGPGLTVVATAAGSPRKATAIQAAPPPAAKAAIKMAMRNIGKNPLFESQPSSEYAGHPVRVRKHDQRRQGHGDPIRDTGPTRVQPGDPRSVLQASRQRQHAEQQDSQSERAAEQRHADEIGGSVLRADPQGRHSPQLGVSAARPSARKEHETGDENSGGDGSAPPDLVGGESGERRQHRIGEKK